MNVEELSSETNLSLEEARDKDSALDEITRLGYNRNTAELVLTSLCVVMPLARLHPATSIATAAVPIGLYLYDKYIKEEEDPEVEKTYGWDLPVDIMNRPEFGTGVAYAGPIVVRRVQYDDKPLEVTIEPFIKPSYFYSSDTFASGLTKSFKHKIELE